MAGYHQPSCGWRLRLLAAVSVGALLLPAASFAQAPASPPQTPAPQGQAQTTPPAPKPAPKKDPTAVPGVTVQAAPGILRRASATEPLAVRKSVATL